MTYVPYHQNAHGLDGHPAHTALHSCDCVAGEDELSQVAAPIGLSREAEVFGLLDFTHMNDFADRNLVPWMNLPRRARHRNEQARLFRQ